MTPTRDVLGIGEPMALFERHGCDGQGRDTYIRRFAGADSNVLIGVARQGHSAALASAVGNDPFGSGIVRGLVDEGVDTTLLEVDRQRPTGVFFKHPTTSERRQVWYYRDGSAASAYAPQVLDLLDRADPRILTISGLTLGLGGAAGLGATAASALVEAHRRGVMTVFDVNLRPGIWGGDRAATEFIRLSRSLQVVLAGREELDVLLQDSDPVLAAAKLCEAGPGTVVVKDGPRGAVVVDRHGSVPVPALPVDDVVDAVGAGDAFTAGLISGLLQGAEVVEAARLGAVLGGEAVRHYGDWEGLPDRATAERLLAELPVTPITDPVPPSSTA